MLFDELAPGLFRLEKVLPGGWGLNMFAVRAGARDLLVHSPTWLGEGTFDALDALGAPSVLVAPNHFHHVHIRRFRERYPGARVVASEGAIPRLARQGHRDVAPLAAVALPEGARWLEPPGLKNGEAWLSLPGDGGPTWIACDAFFNVTRPVGGLMGVALRALKSAPGLALGQTFRWLGVRDRRAYRAWLLEMLSSEQPRRLLVSHGEPVEGDLPEALRRLAVARL